MTASAYLLFDPIAPPSELEKLAAERETAVVLKRALSLSWRSSPIVLSHVLALRRSDSRWTRGKRNDCRAVPLRKLF